MRKKIQAILSVILVIFMMFPSVATAAEEINSIVNPQIIESTGQEVEEDKHDELEQIVPSDKDKEDSVEQDLPILDKEVEDKNQVNEEENTVEDAVNNTTEDTVKEESKSDNIGKKYKKVNSLLPYSSRSLPNYEREEFNLKSQEIEASFYGLEKMTDDKYEVALAYDDGNYTFLDTANTIDEAINLAKSAENVNSGENVLPAVINELGQVVYSTNAMARILKHINGEVYNYFDKTTNLYSDSSMRYAYTYINHGYVDDAPIIEDRGTAALIQVNGYNGWINKDSSKSEYDMIVVPLNQVTNPSYYYTANGILYHFISSNLMANSYKGHTLEVGPAPNYLRDGQEYYSYDGKYFYTDLNVLITDLKGNHRGNSVNSNSAHYSYYKYLPFRSSTTYTAAQLNAFIEVKTSANSKLRGIGEALINAEKWYGVNATTILAVAINESGWGMSSIAQSKNNIFGINAVDSNPGQAANEFSTVQDCVYEFAKNWISAGYSDPADWRYYGGFLGDKYLGANVKYASDPFWGEKASQFAFQVDYYLSGNVNSLQDYNTYQLAILNQSNDVAKSNGAYLYTTTIGAPVVLTKSHTVNGQYEIFAERNTAKSTGKFSGNYDWTDRGHVVGYGLEFINKGKNVVLPHDPTYVYQWIDVNGKYYYYDGDSNLVKGWMKYNGSWYFMDYDTGEMRTGWVNINGSYYYFYDSGAMASGLIEANGHLYYLNEAGVMQTGWHLLNGNWYYFYGSGNAAKGWLQIGSVWYYLYNNGTMATGLIDANGHKYYFNQLGVMQTGWHHMHDNWYYFHGSGDAKIGWLQLGNVWYYLRKDATMATGLTQIGNHKYLFESSGMMVTGWKLINGDWYYFHGSGDAKTGWLQLGNVKYYLNSDAIMVTGWNIIDGKKHYFADSGMMLTNTTIDGVWIDENGIAS